MSFTNDEPQLADHDPELLAAFDAAYEAPDRDAWSCNGCGAYCDSYAHWKIHLGYHRALSLRIFMLGSLTRSVLGVLDTLTAEAADDVDDLADVDWAGP